MQNYFGQEIRSNKGNLYQMKKAVGAILWYLIALSDEEYRHRFCPTGDSSWCSWQRNKNEINRKPPKSTTNIPKWIHDIRPIFDELIKYMNYFRNAYTELQSVSWILAEFYFNRGLQRLYTGTCIILQKTINWFLCLLIVFLKSKTYQLILKDVIKLNRNFRVTDRDKIVAGDPH